MADEMKELLLSLIGSLTLADNQGDIAEDIMFVLQQLGPPYDHLEWEELSDLTRELGKLGVKTLRGTSLEVD
jgi:hypothetical protein